MCKIGCHWARVESLFKGSCCIWVGDNSGFGSDNGGIWGSQFEDSYYVFWRYNLHNIPGFIPGLDMYVVQEEKINEWLQSWSDLMNDSTLLKLRAGE